MTRKIKLGTVIHGTLRTEDLLEAFADELQRIAPSEHATLIYEASTADPESEIAGEVVEELIDTLSEYAPAHCYFGAHEGNGSDFGFWVSWETVEDGIRHGEILKVDDIADIPADHSGLALVVNDHGNASLYTMAKGEIQAEHWAVV